jgi:hypothetical protein
MALSSVGLLFYFLITFAMKYKHKKLWLIAEIPKPTDCYYHIFNKEKWPMITIILKELIEDSNDREPIQEKERTRDWLWIGDNNHSLSDFSEHQTDIKFKFKSEELWKKFENKIEARYEIQKRQELNDDGFEPDRSDEKQKKYYINYGHFYKDFWIDITRVNQNKEFFFSSKEKAQQFIDECWQHFLAYYGIK